MIVRSCWFESSTGHSGPGNAVAGAFFLENFGVDCTQWGLLKPIRGLLTPIGIYLNRSGIYLNQFGAYLNRSGVYLNHFGFSTWRIAKSNIGTVPNQNAYHPWVQGTCGENT